MAVLSSPVAAAEKVNTIENEEMQQELETQKTKVTQKRAKRSKDPGIRVIGARIYDSQNGKTCHQCRQKTMDFTAGCKNMIGNKQCTTQFCHKCLLNRYGENAEEVEARDNWNCPKCRDMCNCSYCMKKKGLKPTGILVHAAKATGFSSVSELLLVKGHDVRQELIAKSKAASVNEPTVLTEGPGVVSPKKRAKENSDGSCNAELNSQSPPASPGDKKARKTKRKCEKGFKERVEIVSSLPEDAMDITVRKSPRKLNITQEYIRKEYLDVDKEDVRRSPRDNNAPQEVVKTEEKMSDDNCTQESKEVRKVKVQAEPKMKSCKVQKEKYIIDEIVEDIVLPSGCMMTNVAGVDLLPDDAGHALQFLEFCSTFGEVLQIQKGHPESVLRDIFYGRNIRKGKLSSTVQFLIQLLSFIMKDMPKEEEEVEEEEEKSPRLSPSKENVSWIQNLKRCLAESELELEDFPEDCFDKGIDGYEMLVPSQKLRLLTFLCDESLSVKEMRTWIDEQNLKFVEKEKEEKESVNAARKKEKEEAKRKLQEKVATLVIAQSGLPLTIAEHDTIISKIKAETECARKEFLEAMDVMPKKRQWPVAVRTDSEFLDDSGHAFWRLGCLGDSKLLLQEVGAPEQIDYKDKWFSFNDEETQVVEKYISSVRLKRYKRTKRANQTKKKSNSDLEVDSSSNDESPPAIDDI